MIHSSRTPLIGPLSGFSAWPLSWSSSQLFGGALVCSCFCALIQPRLRVLFTQAKGVVATVHAAVGHSVSANLRIIPSPRTSAALRGMTPAERDALPYPPYGALPGARDVPTLYGSIRVYEWGPEDGERVLLIAGISTPTLSLGDLAWEMSERGYRVMLFGMVLLGVSPPFSPPDTQTHTRLYLYTIPIYHGILRKKRKTADHGGI